MNKLSKNGHQAYTSAKVSMLSHALTSVLEPRTTDVISDITYEYDLDDPEEIELIERKLEKYFKSLADRIRTMHKTALSSPTYRR